MKKKIRILTSEEMTKYFDTCMLKYGTSAGANAAWDTRGRGQKEETEKPKETPKTQITYKPIDADNMEERIGSQKQIEGIKNMLSNIPEEHIKGISEVSILKRDQFKQWCLTHGRDIEEANMAANEAIATIDPTKGEIAINFPVAKNSELIIPINEVISHEIGHSYLGNKFPLGKYGEPNYRDEPPFVSNFRECVNLHPTSKNELFGNEQGSRWDENFCGFYRMYINHSKVLQIANPNVYNFMKDNVFSGKEYIKETKNLSKAISKPNLYEYKFKDGTKVYSSELIEFPKEELIPNKKIKIVIRRKGTNAKR